MNQGTINFAVYESSKNYIGMTKATLPDLTAVTQSITGAGINGTIEAVMQGQYEAMTLGLDFTQLSSSAISLSTPKMHQIELRAAIQDEDAVTGMLSVKSHKHIFKVIPKSLKGGTVAPASLMDVSGEYAVRYWATYIDGKKVREIDPINCICYINGNDYAAALRKALGK